MKIRLIEIIDNKVESAKNLWAFLTFRTITFQEYMNMECREIFGDENKWYAGENLNHPPSHLDCQQNYINHRADKRFHKRYHYLVERPWQKKVREAFSSMRYSYSSLHKKKNLQKCRRRRELNFSE